MEETNSRRVHLGCLYLMMALVHPPCPFMIACPFTPTPAASLASLHAEVCLYFHIPSGTGTPTPCMHFPVIPSMGAAGTPLPPHVTPTHQAIIISPCVLSPRLPLQKDVSFHSPEWHAARVATLQVCACVCGGGEGGRQMTKVLGGHDSPQMKERSALRRPLLFPTAPLLLRPPPHLQVERPTYDEWLLKRKEDEGKLASVADIEEKRMREYRAGCSVGGEMKGGGGG